MDNKKQPENYIENAYISIKQKSLKINLDKFISVQFLFRKNTKQKVCFIPPIKFPHGNDTLKSWANIFLNKSVVLSLEYCTTKR